MDVLKKEYDIVLVDTPAKPLIFSEVSSVVNATDAMIVLADMNANRETLKNVLERIEKWPTPIIGITTRQRETELQRYFDKANRT
jgi:Mrp family chromosome partitioning ATPase